MVYTHLPTPAPDTSTVDNSELLPRPLADAEERLQRLAQALSDDLEVLSYPAKVWDYPRDARVLEVAIIGAGYTGKEIAFGLRRYGIRQVRGFDRSTPGQEGPWRTYARNATLRTPKEVTGGLDWGIPNLNFRRWCVARYGEAYWRHLRYIPRLMWAEYLDWYGKVLDLPIQHETVVEEVMWQPESQCFHLLTRYQGQLETYPARFVVFATGMESAGGKRVPPMVEQNLPASTYYHTMDAIPFAELQGKRVMVLGGGASAFDNALCALKAGADRVEMAIRRSQLPCINRIRWSEWNGFHRHYIDLPDDLKWYYSLEEIRLGQLPPPPTYYQTISYPNFSLYANAPVQHLAYQ
jgi:cation diffusion facilitator CzcD-associated flavoprotein CzcO